MVTAAPDWYIITAMVKKPWRNPLLPCLLSALWACAPVAVKKTATPPGPVAANASDGAPPTTPPTTPPTAPPVETPRVQLSLTTQPDHTGGEFGLKVPMLRVTLRNAGNATATVAQPGLALLLSLRVVLRRGDSTELRQVTIRVPKPVELQPLPAGAELHQGLSPLSRDQRDVPLPLGRYRVQVCVIPHAEAAYPTAFTEQFGGTCSNEIEIAVEKGVRTGHRG